MGGAASAAFGSALATPAHPAANVATISLVAFRDRLVYFEKNRVFKAGQPALNKLAWNNDKGLRFYFVGVPGLK